MYLPNRFLQGGIDSGNYFQDVTCESFKGRVQLMLQWLDDFLIHAKNEEDLLRDIDRFFEVCHEFGSKIHAEKTVLFIKTQHSVRKTFKKNSSDSTHGTLTE